MGLAEVFKSGKTENATEVTGNISDVSVERKSGPVLDNRVVSKFQSLDLSKVDRDFNKSRDRLTVDSFENSGREDYEDDSNLMDNMINVALEKHKKRSKRNFIFDRIKAISSETKRIQHNLDLGD